MIGLVPFLMAGDGGIDFTLECLLEMDLAKGGPPAFVELGIPFSDPVADGPVLQAAAGRALAAGTTPNDVFRLAERYRDAGGQTPLLAFSYANPLLRGPVESTARRLHDAGFAGAMIPDLPLEEWRPFARALRDRALAPIPFAAPTTSDARLAESLEHGAGFLYAIGRLGITGKSTAFTPELIERLDALWQISHLPVAVGFGIATAAQVRALDGHADLAIVGSALVEHIHQAGSPSGARDFLEQLRS